MSEDSLLKAVTTFNAIMDEWPDFRLSFETFLEGKELSHVIENNSPNIPFGLTIDEKEIAHKKWKKEDAMVRTYIIGKVSKPVLDIIRHKKTAFEMFSTLKSQYESTSMASTVSRIDDLLEYTFNETTDITLHLGKINTSCLNNYLCPSYSSHSLVNYFVLILVLFVQTQADISLCGLWSVSYTHLTLPTM
jgi:hypothetical protein